MSEPISREVLIFELGKWNFALPLSCVEEVVPSTPITRIPSSPPFLLGLAAVRGRVMTVIDAAKRYGVAGGAGSFFLVCSVRGNTTAVRLDRPVIAGEVLARDLSVSDVTELRSRANVNEKFVTGAFELLEREGEAGAVKPTGTICLMVDADLFVSAEMASRVGEAA